MRGIPTDDSVGASWGPTQELIDEMAMRAVVGSWDDGVGERWASQAAESDADSDDVMSGDDDDLLDAVEQAAFVDAYHCDDDRDSLSDM